jgi:hypothetical protein
MSGSYQDPLLNEVDRSYMKTNKFKQQYRVYSRAHPPKLKIAPLERHANHQVEIRPGVAHNAAQYWCLDCNKWVAWVSKQDADAARRLGLF